MNRETFIENNVVRNRGVIIGPGEAVLIRRSRIGRGFGVADLVFLPTRGPHKIVIVEAKQGTSVDSKAKVIGQVLMYYGGALRLGARGIRLMRRFAVEHPRAARSLSPKSLRMLSGGHSPPDAAWKELCKGRKLTPNQVALFIALDAEPGLALTSALSELALHHGLSIGIVSVLGRDQLKVWHAV